MLKYGVDGGELHLVAKELWSGLSGDLRPMALFVTINRLDDLFVWPIALPDETGNHNPYSKTALEGALRGAKGWVKVASNRRTKTYDIFEPEGNLAEPVWPETTMEEIIRTAFRDRYINSIDHPVLRAIRGEE